MEDSTWARVYIGQFIHCLTIERIVVFNGFVAVQNGKIIALGSNIKDWQMNFIGNVEEIKLSSSQFMIPGFIDCHIHASQMPNIGLGIDLPLLEWLEKYTFPMEAKYYDPSFSQRIYRSVIHHTIQCGTTCAAYFATNHRDSSVILAKEIVKQGQRAFVGKVSADCNAPDYYIENFNEAITEAEAFVKDVKALGSNLVKPIITPRFAVSCSEALMTSLSQLAEHLNVNIQSHISENLEEIEIVKKKFGKPYAKVYHDAGLLRQNKCILAHAIYLDDDELAILRETNTSVAHCPASNTNLGSGLCNVRRILSAGIKVGLGTDVSGGHSASILDTIVRCLDVSKHISLNGNKLRQNYKALDFREAFYLATLGGAEALNIANTVGNFCVGKSFDALLIEIGVFPIYQENICIGSQTVEDGGLNLLQKFIYTGDDRNIKQVFVEGKPIK